MTAKKHFVQSNGATARHTSGSNLTPKSLNLRQVRRAAAAFNNETGCKNYFNNASACFLAASV
jgi:hypothetical protein